MATLPPNPATGTNQNYEDVPPLTCPCGAGPCSVGTARNGQRFYFCSLLTCTYRKWCDGGSSSECYICREEGHWYWNCPRLPPSAVAAAANEKEICFCCKQEIHYAGQCLIKNRRYRRRN